MALLCRSSLAHRIASVHGFLLDLATDTRPAGGIKLTFAKLRSAAMRVAGTGVPGSHGSQDCSAALRLKGVERWPLTRRLPPGTHR